jgi:hypothetical protein
MRMSKGQYPRPKSDRRRRTLDAVIYLNTRIQQWKRRKAAKAAKIPGPK